MFSVCLLKVSHTEVAEHLVSSVLEQCDLLEIGNDPRKFQIETERLISKLEHTRAFNTLLQSSLEEVKLYGERYLIVFEFVILKIMIITLKFQYFFQCICVFCFETVTSDVDVIIFLILLVLFRPWFIKFFS